MPPPPTLQLGSSERATFGLSSETVSDEVSLPYIDVVSGHELKAAETMVQEEMRRMPKREKDYLADVRASTSSRFKEKEFAHLTPAMIEEYTRRFEKNEPKSNPDTSRYEVPPPSVKHKTNASKWEESVANAKSQLEHTALRMQNLELMQKYAANAWRKHLEELEEVVKEYEGLVRKVDDQLEMVNSKRRLSQEEAQGHLRELNDEWISMTRKCALIEEKLRQMEKDEEIGMQ